MHEHYQYIKKVAAVEFKMTSPNYIRAIKKKDNPEKFVKQTNTSKTKHNTICIGNHYVQTNTNNVNKTSALLQTTGGKDELNIVFRRKS